VNRKIIIFSFYNISLIVTSTSTTLQFGSLESFQDLFKFIYAYEIEQLLIVIFQQFIPYLLVTLPEK
jgi:hypothetical protein